MVIRRVHLITLCLALFAVQAAWGAGDGRMSVQVKKSQVRTAPSFMARIVATLAYGDRVDIVAAKGAWSQVLIPDGGGRGWVHTSALTKKKIVLKAGDADVDQAATSDELALAGKGFNKKVEGEFKANNQDLDYAWVDRMETLKASNNTIRKFLQAGDVSPKGGAQ